MERNKTALAVGGVLLSVATVGSAPYALLFLISAFFFQDSAGAAQNLVWPVALIMGLVLANIVFWGSFAFKNYRVAAITLGCAIVFVFAEAWLIFA